MNQYQTWWAGWPLIGPAAVPLTDPMGDWYLLSLREKMNAGEDGAEYIFLISRAFRTGGHVQTEAGVGFSTHYDSRQRQTFQGQNCVPAGSSAAGI